MVGAIYTGGVGKSSTAAADWATASLSGDVKVEIKKSGAGVTALYLNDAEWVPHESSGIVIPDGYLAILTTPAAKITVKESATPDNQPDNGDNKPNEGGSGGSTPAPSTPSFGYITKNTFTKFSNGESAIFTMSVDELGTDWFSTGLTIVVSSTLRDSLPAEVWQTTGADGVFSLSFQKNDKNQMVGTLYRGGVNKASTATADWATASLSGDVTVEIKKNASGVTALYLNGAEWVPHSSSGISIPDGYLAIVTTPGAKITQKAAQKPSADGGNANGQLNGTFGYYSLKKFAEFSKGESAALSLSVKELGTDWFSTGLTIVVSSTLRDSLPNEVWQTTGADGVFTFSFKKNSKNQMVGALYRGGVNKSSTASADWAAVSLDGTITIEVKKNGGGVTALYLNGTEWIPHGSSGISIPDGYLAIATTPGAKVTVKEAQNSDKNDTSSGTDLPTDGFDVDMETEDPKDDSEPVTDEETKETNYVLVVVVSALATLLVLGGVAAFIIIKKKRAAVPEEEPAAE